MQGTLSRVHGVHFQGYKGYTFKGTRGTLSRVRGVRILARVHVPQKCTGKNTTIDMKKPYNADAKTWNVSQNVSSVVGFFGVHCRCFFGWKRVQICLLYIPIIVHTYNSLLPCCVALAQEKCFAERVRFRLLVLSNRLSAVNSLSY